MRCGLVRSVTIWVNGLEPLKHSRKPGKLGLLSFRELFESEMDLQFWGFIEGGCWFLVLDCEIGLLFWGFIEGGSWFLVVDPITDQTILLAEINIFIVLYCT